jgi:hypothetical protein
MLQLNPTIKIKNSRKMPIDEHFRRFHEENPHIYKNLLHLAIQAQLAGRKKIGMKLLYERLRWEYLINSKYELTQCEMDNNFTSRYARKLMEDVPYLHGLFETRDLRTR